MLPAVTDAVSVVIEALHVVVSSIAALLHWVTTEVLPVVVEFIVSTLPLVSSAALLGLQLVLETVQRHGFLIYTLVLSLLEGLWDVVTAAIPLAWYCLSSASLALYSLGQTVCSVTTSCVITAYSIACDAATFIIPNAVLIFSGLINIFLTIVAGLAQGTVAIVAEAWNVTTFLFSSLLSTGGQVTHTLWSITSHFLSADILHEVEKTVVTTFQMLHTLTVYALKVVVVIVTITVLLVVVRRLYRSAPVIWNHWLRLQQYLYNKLQRHARQNAPEEVHGVDRPRQQHRVTSRLNVDNPRPAPLPSRQPGSPPTSPSPPHSSGSPTTNDGDTNRLCVVCIDNERQVLLRPCNHYCVCDVCSRRLGGVCPMCRANFTSSEVIHIFYD